MFPREINFDGWYKANVRVWLKSTKMRSNFLNLQSASQTSPTFLLLHLTIVELIQYFSCLFFFLYVRMNTVKNDHNYLTKKVNWLYKHKVSFFDTFS